MKLAEALIKRADLQKKFNELRMRIGNNIQVQEDEKPSEDPEELIEQAIIVLRELESYIIAINKTNSLTVMDSRGMTITEAIAKRDALKSKCELYQMVASSGTVGPRYSRSEIKTVSVIDVNIYRKLSDDAAKEFRNLDTEIQTANWNTDLLGADQIYIIRS
jgi:hypothetical protein